MAELKRTFAEDHYYTYVSQRKEDAKKTFLGFCIRCFRLFFGISLLLYGLVCAAIFIVEGAIMAGITILCLPILGIRLVVKKPILPEVKDDQFTAYQKYLSS